MILEGLEALLGLESTKPIIGMRDEIDPDAGDLFEPCYWLLVDLPKEQFREERLWVKDGHLLYGESKENLTDFHRADYVLFSLCNPRQEEMSEPCLSILCLRLP